MNRQPSAAPKPKAKSNNEQPQNKNDAEKSLDSGTVLIFNPTVLNNAVIPPMPPATVDSFMPSANRPRNVQPHRSNAIDPRVAAIPYPNHQTVPAPGPNSYSAMPPGRVRLVPHPSPNNSIAAPNNRMTTPPNVGPYNGNTVPPYGVNTPPTIHAPAPRTNPEAQETPRSAEPSILPGSVAATPIRTDDSSNNETAEESTATDSEPSANSTPVADTTTPVVPRVDPPVTAPAANDANAVVATPNTTAITPTPASPAAVPVSPVPSVAVTPVARPQPSESPNGQAPIYSAPQNPAAPSITAQTTNATTAIALAPPSTPTEAKAENSAANGSNNVPGGWIALLAIVACGFAGTIAWSIAKQDNTPVERPKPPRFYLDALIGDQLAVVEERPNRDGVLQFHGAPNKVAPRRIDLSDHDIPRPHFAVPQTTPAPVEQSVPIENTVASVAAPEKIDLEQLKNTQAAGLVKLAKAARDNSEEQQVSSEKKTGRTIRFDGAHKTEDLLSGQTQQHSDSQTPAPHASTRRSRPRANSVMQATEDGSSLLDRALSVVQPEGRKS